MSRDVVFCMVIRLRAGRSGVRITVEARDFPILWNVHTGSRTDRSFYVYWKLFLGVKRPGSEFDHWRPSSAEVLNEWIHTSNPPVCLRDVDRDRCTFTFCLCNSRWMKKRQVSLRLVLLNHFLHIWRDWVKHGSIYPGMSSDFRSDIIQQNLQGLTVASGVKKIVSETESVCIARSHMWPYFWKVCSHESSDASISPRELYWIRTFSPEIWSGTRSTFEMCVSWIQV
jgi:hypothetical protein